MNDPKDITLGPLNIWYRSTETPEVLNVFFQDQPGRPAVDILPAIQFLGVEWQVKAMLKDHLE